MARRQPRSQRRSASAQRRNTRSDLGARVAAAIPAIAFALFIVIQGGLVFTAGLVALGLVCLHELYTMFDSARPAKLAGFVGLAGMALAAYYGDQFHIMLALAAAIPVTFFVAVNQARPGGAASIAVTILGLAWIGVAISHAILLRELEHGMGIVIDVLVGTFIGDTGAYLGGRMFGSQPLAPRISPNKTVEGLGIGLLTCVVAVVFAGFYQDWLTTSNALILGLAVGLAAPVGDLFESYLKRDAGTKDTGTLFGAHGGALDRLDAVFFTVVVGYFTWVAML
jgi:phosphatidate cytidylyltransferase